MKTVAVFLVAQTAFVALYQYGLPDLGRYPIYKQLGVPMYWGLLIFPAFYCGRVTARSEVLSVQVGLGFAAVFAVSLTNFYITPWVICSMAVSCI